jgi:Kef-type K+ transport system membrane component KefB
MSGSLGSRRLAIHYTLLALVTAGILAFVFSTGSSKHAQPAIAGGYDVSSATACLGAKIELAQSGRYVTLSNTRSTIGGSLKFVHGRLTGKVSCLRGHHAQLSAHVAGGILAGVLGGVPVSAQVKRDPPEPGAPKPLAPNSVGGEYKLSPSSSCLGGSMKLVQSGTSVKVITSKKPRGVLTYRAGALAGAVACKFGGSRVLAGTATGRSLELMLTPSPAAQAALLTGASATHEALAGGAPARPAAAAATAAPALERIVASKQRTAEQTVVAFFIAVVIVMLFARLMGSLMPRIGQPRVMGEVLAGLLLGPTLFGAIAPQLQSTIFASDIVPYIGVAANLGLVFFMFLIGLEVDLGQLRGRARMTFVVSNTALLVPLMLGALVALPLYPLLAPNTRFAAFALFVGVSMSVTAFPVLARIISERRMLKRPLGALALSAAAVDDVSAWFLIALATAVASAGSGLAVLETIGWAAVFCLGMAFLVRPVLARAAVAYDEAGRVPGTWITVIFAGVLLSAIATETIGIAVIFGAFVMGIVMPRHAGLSEDITRRVEDFVLTLLLPLFFAYTGLRTNVALLGTSELALITLGLCAIAIVGKYGGTLIAARVIRLPWRESAVLGALMNTRGLTELIVLNLALSLGVISQALFTALVIMALVTTFMAGPLIRLLDPHNSFGEDAEEELAAVIAVPSAEPTGARPQHSILVAPQSDAALEQLLALAEPLARSEPRRELILARLIRPPRGAGVRGGLQTEARLVESASEELRQRRAELEGDGVNVRAVAFTSADAGRDLTRLSRSEQIDLVLLDGRRPLLGDGVPREEVGTVLSDAKCDVAVLVAREGVEVSPGPDRSVMVPFGGADHDWAALELAAWIAAASNAPLQLLGSAGQREDGRDASGLLANASLIVQQFAGVSAEPVLAQPGRDGILAATAGAGLLLVGLSERWQKEGLGETRRAIARSAPAPIVFVRRGERAGALAPATEMTRFGWSAAGLGEAG